MSEESHPPSSLEDVWRREVPHVLGALVRRYGERGDLGAPEDAVQEALLAASQQWPVDGVPEDPRAWLVRVASRRLVDAWRSSGARLQREVAVATAEPADSVRAPAPDLGDAERDDTLDLLLLCCHPVLTPASRVALTLRAVAGLSTAQVAVAFGVPEATAAQRISRARATLREAGVRLGVVGPDELPDRVDAVLRVLYLVHTEGHTASSGDDLGDAILSREAVRLARALHERLPEHDETTGLLALMLLTEARRASRTDAGGDLVPLEHQDRTGWDARAIAQGIELVEGVLPRGVVGTYQLQAAIAAVHAGAATWADTDMAEVAELYRMLARVEPSPAVTLNLAVAVGETDGPAAGLTVLRPLLAEPAIVREHRLHAVHAHLLESAGEATAATHAYAEAARLATNVREQRYLNRRLEALLQSRPTPGPDEVPRPDPHQ